MVSTELLAELRTVLGYPKIERRLSAAEARQFLRLLEEEAISGELLDPKALAELPRPRDPDDEHLVALAAAAGAVIVSGDRHLTELAPDLPVYTPAGFLELLAAGAHGS